MTSISLKLVLAAAVAALGSSASVAEAQRARDCVGETEQYVGRQYTGVSQLRISSMLARCAGAEPSAVILRAESRRGNGTAQLFAGGRMTSARQRLGTNLRDHVFSLPSLGRGRTGDLMFQFSGNVYVESVSIVFDDFDRDDRDDRGDRPGRGGLVNLGTTEHFGRTSDSDTIYVGRQLGAFSGLQFRAVDDDVNVTRVEIRFENGTVLTIGAFSLDEGRAQRFTFGGRSRRIESIYVSGRQGRIFGTEAAVEVLGIR